MMTRIRDGGREKKKRKEKHEREKGREKRKSKDTEKEKVKVSVLHGCSKHKSTRFDFYVSLEKR